MTDSLTDALPDQHALCGLSVKIDPRVAARGCWRRLLRPGRHPGSGCNAWRVATTH